MRANESDWPQVSQLHNAVGCEPHSLKGIVCMVDRDTSCLHFGSIVWLPGLTQVRNTKAHHFGSNSLSLNPRAFVNSEHRGHFWPRKVVHLSGPLCPAAVYEAWLFHPCLGRAFRENPLQLLILIKPLIFCPLAASSICCIFNREEARVELR